MTRDATTAFARTLVDEWARHGVTDACLAPGSRSAPLALALAERRTHPAARAPRRALGFVLRARPRACALVARRSLLCTSGTAAANFHPAVLEAHHGRVPMIVCTADRPPELRDTGAGQTVDQVEALRRRRPLVPRGERARRPARRRRRVAGAGVARGRRRPSARPPDRCTSTSRSASRWCRPVSRWSTPPGARDDRPWTAHVPGRAGAVGRDARRAGPPRGRPAARPRGRGMGCRRPAVDDPALRRGRRVAGARRPALEPAGARHHRHLRPAAARSPRSPARTGPTSCCASAARSPTRSRCSGSTRRSTRCSSIPTARGSIRCTRRAGGWSPTPSCCSRRWPTPST